MSITDQNRPLSENELMQLSTDKIVRWLMILLFLVENTALEYLRRKNKPYNAEVVLVSEIWEEIEEALSKRLFLSREISAHFSPLGGKNSKEFKSYLAAGKSIRIDNLITEAFISNNKENTVCSLYLTGKYVLKESTTSNQSLLSRKPYQLFDRKICRHPYLYDPFQFGDEPQNSGAHRYINESLLRKKIASIFTVIDAKPELTVLLTNGTFIKVVNEDIPDFLAQNISEGEINETLYNAIKNDYPRLFYPPLNMETAKNINVQLKKLITTGINESEKTHKPLLIVLAEIHDSKDSFLLQIMVLLIAKQYGINHLLSETINLYHFQQGWDAPVQATIRLLSFAESDLEFGVKDLERSLHYHNIETPYPYHAIPEERFGIEARETSWIMDIKMLGKNAVLILGAGHLNSILNSDLKNSFIMLPINCTCDKKYSDLLSITDKNLITFEHSLRKLTLDEIINIAKNAVGGA